MVNPPPEELSDGDDDAGRIELPRAQVFGHIRKDEVFLGWLARGFLGALVGFALCTTYYNEYLHRPPAPAAPLTLCVAGGVGVAMVLPRGRKWRQVRVGPDGIVLRDVGGGEERVDGDRVRAVASEYGVSLDGGAIYRLKWLWISTDAARFKVRLWADAPSCYIALLQRAPRAVGIAHDGAVHVPSEGRSNVTPAGLRIVEEELSRQTRRSTIISGALLGLSVLAALGIGFGFARAPEKEREGLIKLSVYVIVMLIIAITLAGATVRRWRVGRRMLDRIRAFKPQQRPPEIAGHWLIPSNAS